MKAIEFICRNRMLNAADAAEPWMSSILNVNLEAAYSAYKKNDVMQYK